MPICQVFGKANGKKSKFSGLLPLYHLTKYLLVCYNYTNSMVTDIVPYQDDPETLRDLLKGITGKPRDYLVLRIAGIPKEDALASVNSDKWGLASWNRDRNFYDVHHAVKKWEAEFKSQAIKMMRRSNQLLAAMFERDVILILMTEVATGQHKLIKTQIAKEIYAKLINDLDTTPAVQHNSWEQNIGKIIQGVNNGSTDNGSAESTEDTERQKRLDEVAAFQGSISNTEESPSSGVFTIQEETTEEKIDGEYSE
jgi:hypothetical protein